MLPVIEKFEFLKKRPIFSEAGEEVLMKLASRLKEREVLKGAVIIRKGDMGDTVFMIVEGKVRIHDGNHVLARMQEGEVFGEYALIDRNVRSASVTAEENCLLLQLGNEDFYQVAAGDPGILRGVLKELIRRMREMNVLEEKLSKSYLKIRHQKELIEKQNDSISQQKLQLEQQNFDLSKLNEEKNQLISTVIHQIKNPLTSALCMAEMLDAREGYVDEVEREGLSIIRNSIKRINNLVNEILDVSAIDSKVYQLRSETLDIRSILEELIENYRYFIEQKNIRLNISISRVEAKLNRVYITQIIDNLLSNAVKFSPEDGTVTIGLNSSGPLLILSIADEGPGIPEDKAREVFEQYRRQTSMIEQGNAPEGLGLAIVNRYTGAMQGTVKLETTPGKGTTFIVELPTNLSA